LDHLVPACSHRGIIFNLDVLQALDQSSLDVASLGSLNCGIDETLSTSHCMEVEFLRCQPQHIIVGDESFTIWTEIILGKVRQCSPVEPKWDTLTLYVLLTDTCHDLGDVQVTTFRATGHHLFQPVVRVKVLQGCDTCFLSCFVQDLINFSFETLEHTFSWEAAQITSLSLLDDLLNDFLLFLNLTCDVFNCFFACNNVLDSDCETSLYQPIIDYILQVGHKQFASLRSMIPPDNMNETSSTGANISLLHPSTEELSILYDYMRVFRTVLA